MPLSLKEVNRQRQVMEYEFHHLYSRAKFGTNLAIAPALQTTARAEGAQYGVLVRYDNGRQSLKKYSSYELCLKVAEARNGTVIRLGRTSQRAYDQRAPTTGQYAHLPKALVDESGNIEWMEIERGPAHPSHQTISADLEGMGHPRAIQYSSTRPTAADLFTLHRRHQNVSMEDFAVAVVKHFEPNETAKKAEAKPPILSRTEEEREAWYSTPAGQLWAKEHPIPPIMRHTKKELLGWKSRERSKS